MLRVKREYQSWVAKESLEDYALRHAASSYRRWAPRVMANTAIGGISFLALEAIGASITLSYGFQNAMTAIVVASIVIFLVSLPIAYACAVSNVDIDLLTRGAGFGYLGSTITSLIYAGFTFIFFALETAIWAQALNLATGLGLPLGYLLCSLVIVPVVFYGVTAINQLQAWTQPLWLALLVLPVLLILCRDPSVVGAWTSYAGLDGSRGHFDPLLFGAAAGVMLALAAQIGEQADYLRFLPERTAANRREWWAALLAAGPGWILIGAAKVTLGSLLAVLALRTGASAAQAVEPAHMFVHAYRQVVADPGLALALAALFVTVSQVKINVTNAYSGSLAWSNCFVRLAHYHPGRVVWLVFNVVIALLLTLLGIFETLQTVLSVYSTVALAWIGALVADLVVLKRSGISPPFVEFKRANLHDFNPVGCGATALAAAVALLAYAGVFGPWGQAFFGFVALALSFVAAIVIGYATRGSWYLARQDDRWRGAPRTTLVECCVCEREYEAPDMVHCPLYGGSLCSLCCGLELHCHDFCKRPAGAEAAPRPARFRPQVLRRFGRFLGLLGVVAVLIGAAFLLTYRFMDLHDAATRDELVRVMTRLYVATLAVASLGAWWIVLSHEAQEQGERELLESLQHLESTRASLVETEKLASLGSLVAGVAHEINTPVGITVTSASFLSDRIAEAEAERRAGRLDDEALGRYLADAAGSARLLQANATRMAQLVQNFKQLAIDRVPEARRRLDLRETVDETLAALAPRIAEAGIELRLEIAPGLVLESYPVALAQVLSNLVLNAVQHAFEPGAHGARRLLLRAEADDEELRLDVADNGRGIAPALRTRVFEPFYTTRRLQGGSGLGLYIVNQIVARQLGGALVLDTAPGGGARFALRLPRIARQTPDVGRILGALPRTGRDEA